MRLVFLFISSKTLLILPISAMFDVFDRLRSITVVLRDVFTELSVTGGTSKARIPGVIMNDPTFFATLRIY